MCSAFLAPLAEGRPQRRSSARRPSGEAQRAQRSTQLQECLAGAWRVCSCCRDVPPSLGSSLICPKPLLVCACLCSDLAHLDNPVNAIVAAIQPSVKQIVWEVSKPVFSFGG